MTKKLKFDADEKAALVASFDVMLLVWVGLYGGYSSFAPRLETDFNEAGEPTEYIVLCPLVAKSARLGKVPPGLAKKITDEIEEEEPHTIKPKEVRL